MAETIRLLASRAKIFARRASALAFASDISGHVRMEGGFRQMVLLLAVDLFDVMEKLYFLVPWKAKLPHSKSRQRFALG